MLIDMRVLELLASKLCHDIISPVSAINNGVELIEDIGGSVVAEAMTLIGDSAGQASRRLKLYRIAYGRAGSEEGLAVRDAKLTIEQYMSTGKVTLNWPDDLPASALGYRGFLKVLLNLLVLAEEVLAYGGSAVLKPINNFDMTGCRLEVVGRNALLSEPMKQALDGVTPIDEISPRTVHAYMTGRFTEHFNLILKTDQSIPDRLDLILLAPLPVGAT